MERAEGCYISLLVMKQNVNRFSLAIRRYAGKQKGPRFESTSALLSLRKGCGLWTHCLVTLSLTVMKH